MHGSDSLACLQFNDDHVLHQKIDPISNLQAHRLVNDRQGYLGLDP